VWVSVGNGTESPSVRCFRHSCLRGALQISRPALEPDLLTVKVEWLAAAVMSMKQTARVSRALISQFLAFSAVWLPIATADEICTNLPESSLTISAIKAEKVAEKIVSKWQFETMEHAEAGALQEKRDQIISRSSAMIGTINLVASFGIGHRISQRGDGLICDSPVHVQLNFGPIQPIVIMSRDVATNQCMRRPILRHEAEQAAAAQKVIDRFVVDQASDYQNLMRNLKQLPAPNAEVAIRRWHAALSFMVEVGRSRLVEDIRSAVARVDRLTPEVSSDECTDDDRH
jgi:hypothetical protein